MPLLRSSFKAGLIGLVAGPVVTGTVLAVMTVFDPSCRFSSGGCEMATIFVPLIVALPCFALGFLGRLIYGLLSKGFDRV